MQYHFLTNDPVTHDPIAINDVTVTAVHPDGTYDATAPGWGEFLGLAPTAVPLYDEDNYSIDPSLLVSSPSVAALQQQLLETQAALATMYETLTTIVAGGGL